MAAHSENLAMAVFMSKGVVQLAIALSEEGEDHIQVGFDVLTYTPCYIAALVQRESVGCNGCCHVNKLVACFSLLGCCRQPVHGR